MRHWVISYGRDGFALHVEEKSRLGSALAWLIEHSDMDWWGRYKNIPFCWINPWGWTFHIGRKGHTLGDGWMHVGNRLFHWAWKLEKTKNLIKLPLTDAQVREHFPDTWAWATDLMDDEDEDDDQPAEPE